MSCYWALAAGAVNEGIIAGTWYKVQYPGYALVGGFDPAVAVGLTVFHALVSTVLTILLVEIIFPDVAAAPWLRRPGVRGCLLLLAVATASGFGSAADRDRKVVVLAGVVAAVTAALSLAGRGNSAPMTSLRPAPGIGRLRLAGAAAMVTFYALFAAVPGLIEAGIPPAARGPWQLVPVLLMAGFCWEVVSVGRDWAGRPGWGRPQTLAVITGVLLPTIVASVLLPAARQSLEPLVTIPVLGLLVWLSLRNQQAARLAAGCG